MLGDRSGQGEANEGEKEIHVRLSTVKNLTKTYFFKKKSWNPCASCGAGRACSLAELRDAREVMLQDPESRPRDTHLLLL